MKNLILISAFSLILYTNNAQAHHAFAADSATSQPVADARQLRTAGVMIKKVSK